MVPPLLHFPIHKIPDLMNNRLIVLRNFKIFLGKLIYLKEPTKSG